MEKIKLQSSEVVSQEFNEKRTQEVGEKIALLQDNISHVIKGKSEVIQLCLIGLLARGHILIEDIPGVGKSTLAHCLAASLGLSFQRIQFTSDLLPSDILGVTVYDERQKNFHLRKGPIFSNIVLADEINRSTPKTQSALLEAMNEGQVTIESESHILPDPFMVIATQNPVEHQGTFPLPESQMDRFLLRVQMGYPDFEYERQVLRSDMPHKEKIAKIKDVLTCEELLQMQKWVDFVRLSEPVETYLLSIVKATRHSDLLALGVSTRGALSLARAAKSRALVLGRNYCMPDDIKKLAVSVLGHRVIFEQRSGHSGRRSADTDDIIQEIVSQVSVPL